MSETRFRKRPVVVEAWQFTEFPTPKPQWLTDAINAGCVWMQGGSASFYSIFTMKGVMRVELNDWIIRGVKGELYPCKPDIFAATYEPATEGSET